VWGWGDNEYGSIGNGNTTTPVKVPDKSKYEYAASDYRDLNDAVEVAAGDYHVLAIRKIDNTGTVWTWGRNDNRQLGHSSGTSQLAYARQIITPGEMGNIISVSAARKHSVALDENGDVWTWGSNSMRELGTSSTNSYEVTPAKVSRAWGADVKIVQIAAGASSFVAVLDENGYVWVWGDNSAGQHGIGTTTPSFTATPSQVRNSDDTGPLSNIIHISTGRWFIIALDSSGKVWGWGINDYKQVSSGGTPITLPVEIGMNGVCTTDPAGFIVRTSAGYRFANTIKSSDGSVWSWGRNDNGQLGNNSTTDSASPVSVKKDASNNLLTNVYQSICIYNAGAALDTDGYVWTWGRNNSSQLGINKTSAEQTRSEYAVKVFNPYTLTPGFNLLSPPEPPPIPTATVSGTVTLGDTNIPVSGAVVEISTSGGTFDTVTDSYGDYEINDVPVGEHEVSITATGYTSHENQAFEVEETGTVYDVNLYAFVSVVAGDRHGVALDSNGNVWCWGYNDQGQLGDGTRNTTAAITRPVKVIKNTDDQPLSGIKAIAANFMFTLALDEDGYVWGWGVNWNGTLGDGSWTRRTKAVKVKAQLGSDTGTLVDLSNIKSIQAGYYHALALDTSGQVWSWGYDHSGGLGTDTSGQSDPGYSNRALRVLHSDDSNFNNISAIGSAAGYSSFAIDNDGYAWAWGNNTYG
jgi:alpha-tubulin suppressor-like RCC1 family protein